jgi:hypothetical protein
MYIGTQFSIFLINKPGILAQVLNALAAARINIIAMTMMDSVEHGVLRLVTGQTDLTRDVIKQLNLQVNETDVLCVTLSNKPGDLAAVSTRLSEAHININYCYVTAGARGGKTTGVLKVADLQKAMKTLEKSWFGKEKSQDAAVHSKGQKAGKFPQRRRISARRK